MCGVSSWPTGWWGTPLFVFGLRRDLLDRQSDLRSRYSSRMGWVESAVTWGISVAALGVSVLAYRRTTLGDKRAHEHRNVSWEGEWRSTLNGKAEFALKNTGTTAAKKVRARVYVGNGYREALNLGSFEPGRERVILVEVAGDQGAAEVLIAAIRKNGAPFSVNWVSKLGKPDFYERIVPQIF